MPPRRNWRSFAAEAFLGEVEERPADHAGGRPARALYARRPDAAGGAARAREQIRQAAADPSGGDEGRGRDRLRTRITRSPARPIWMSWACGTAGRLRRTRVWLDAADMHAAQPTRQVGLAHNPESNMKLASGVAAVPAWLSRGLRAGLGTDGAASNNDLDMFEAMRAAALLQKVRPAIPTRCPRARRSSWRRGAAPSAVGLGDRIGSLEAGQAGGPDHRHGGRRAADADVQSDVASGICVARRRRADDRWSPDAC